MPGKKEELLKAEKINLLNEEVFSENKDLRGKNQALEQEIEGLRQEVAEDVGRFRDEYDKLNSTLTDTRKMNASLSENNAELRKKLILALDGIHGLKKELCEVKQKQAEEVISQRMFSENDELKKELEKIKRELTSVKHHATEEASKVRMENGKLSSSLEEMQKFNATISEKNAELRKKLLASLEFIQNYKKDLLRTEEELSAVKKQLWRAEQPDAPKAEVQLPVKEEEYKQLKKTSQAMVDENASLKSKVEELRQKLMAELESEKEIKERSEKLRQNLMNTKRSYDAVLKELLEKNQLIDKMNEVVDVIRSKSKIMSNEGFALIEENNRIKIENEELRRIIDERTRTLEKKELYYPVLLRLEKQLEEETAKKEFDRSVEREVELRFIIEQLSQRVLEQNLLIDKQKEVMNDIRQRERNLVLEFNGRFKEILGFGSEKQLEVANRIERRFSSGISKLPLDKNNTTLSAENNQKANEVKSIIDLVSVALQHKDSLESIHNSLLNSGYDEKIIKEAIQKFRE